ncbi:MAG: NUDIX domain-containing protein [Bacteroidetes bacterium]|nr:NUDIX domain-containing protein [Bacteroidota bacterium]MBL7103028.1 NUDIX domain-containing protein [Bacteroidales bacterium]
MTVSNYYAGQGLTEYEFDHVFVGRYDDEPKINHDEVNDWKFVSMEQIKKDINRSSERYSVWFRIAIALSNL